MKFVSLLILGEAGPKRRLAICPDPLTMGSRQMWGRGQRTNSHGTGVPTLVPASCSAFPRAREAIFRIFSWCHSWGGFRSAALLHLP